MTDDKMILERDLERNSRPAGFTYDDLARRRDRKRRNQRITAGVVGLAVFVAAVWIVTSVKSLDRSDKSVVPGGAGTTAQTGPAQTGPAQTIGPVPKEDYLLDLNTGETALLPDGLDVAGGGASEYTASPDGSRLAYTARADSGGRQIFVANLDGTRIEQVTHDLEAAVSPAWSPDGSKIAYIGDHDDRLRDLFVLDLGTGESTQLTFATRQPDPAAPDLHPWDASSPSFTPDGSSIVYGADRSDSFWNSVEFEIRMVPITGGESVRLMESRGDAIWQVVLSPDGSLLSYNCHDSSAVCVANADGTGERVLVSGGGDAINGPRWWSPDGTRIAYYTFHAQDVFVVDVATGQAIHVAEGSHPTWLDDQTLIVEAPSCYDPATGGRRGEAGCLG